MTAPYTAPSPWGAAFSGAGNVLSTLAMLMQMREQEKRREAEGQTRRSVEASQAFERGIRTPDQVGAEIGPRLGTPGISHAGTTLVESQPQTDPHSDPFRTSTLGHDQENRTGALDVLRRLNQQQRPSGAVAPTRPTDLGPNPRFTGLPTGDFQNIDELPSVRAMRTAEAEQARRAREREEQRAFEAQRFEEQERVRQRNALERIDRTQTAITSRSGRNKTDDEEGDYERDLNQLVSRYMTPRFNRDGDVLPGTGLSYQEARTKAEMDLAPHYPSQGPTQRSSPSGMPVIRGGQLPPEWEDELSALTPEEQQEYVAYLQNPESLAAG